MNNQYRQHYTPKPTPSKIPNALLIIVSLALMAVVAYMFVQRLDESLARGDKPQPVAEGKVQTPCKDGICYDVGAGTAAPNSKTIVELINSSSAK